MTTRKETKGSADHIDTYVGKRIKQARGLSGISMEKLALHMNISYQQIQKYETGKNRIAAGRLHLCAAVLDKPIAWFFPE